MSEKILKLARTISGAGEAEEILLQALCVSEEAYWRNRLGESVSPESCGEAFFCAVAFTAAANLLAVSQDNISSFTAGEISVKLQDSNSAADKAMKLRQTAERMMAPYTEAEDFCFIGVRG